LNTHKFAVLSRQYWQDLLHIPGFCFSPKGIILVLQDQVSWQARWCLQNKKWVCLKTLYW